MALPLLRIPDSCCIPFTKPQSFPSKSLRKTTVAAAELQTPVGVTGGTDYQSLSVDAPTHKVTVHDRQRGIVHEFLVPEDQYILHTAESQNITLPFACRHGCCTSCAVRIKNGQIRQPEALGISAELKERGYALLCVGFPSSDVEVETQDEDEYTGFNLDVILPEDQWKEMTTRWSWPWVTSEQRKKYDKQCGK